MKRLFAAMSLALLVSMFVGAGVVWAQATTETYSEVFEIGGGYYNPCNGQFANFEGTQRIVFHVTDDAAGNHHVVIRANTQGSGVDPVTGEKFLFRDAGGGQEFTVQDGTTAVFTNAGGFRVISQGPSPDYLFHVNYTITVNANGEPTAEQDNIFLECQGQGNLPDPES
jgi:hypothetical protein